MKKNHFSKKIVINADDFGYFNCVSRGIIECARSSAITATGVMANGPNFSELSNWLQEVPHIDIGVHLNLTYGLPVSKDCRDLFSSSGGGFKSKLATAAMLMRREMSLHDVRSEWRAQIDKCLAVGLDLVFINSHEHIHIVPAFERLLPELSQEYGIDLIRQPTPDWNCRPVTKSTLMRNLLIGLSLLMKSSNPLKGKIRVLGIGASGKLNLSYLENCFSTLKPNESYELMCHPGINDSKEIIDRRLAAFHAWDQEREVLMSDEMRALLQRYNVKPCRFHELDQI